MANKKSKKILIIIPCFNEEGNIGRLLYEISIVAGHYDTLVVDDGSSDETYCIATAHSRCLKLSVNLGIGGAVQTGIRYAYENGYDYCIQVDGDGQHPPDQIKILVRTSENSGANLLIGSRFLSASEFVSTATRRFGIRFISFVISMLYGKHVTDPTSGFRLMDRIAMKLYSKEYPTDYPEPISIAVAFQSGLTVLEVPVSMRAREAGMSSINGLKPFIYMLRVIGYLFLVRMKGYL